MEPRELSPSLLESLVAVVATLGELAAAVAGADGDVQLAVSPWSLHKGLVAFIGHLQDTLDHQGSARLGQALAALRAGQGATWAHVAAEATAWRDSVATVADKWAQAVREATELCEACAHAAIAEATAEATAAATAGDLGDEMARWGTARDSLVATTRQLLEALGKALGKALDKGPDQGPDKASLASAAAEYETEVAAATDKVATATKAMEEATVATSKARAAATRKRRAEAALGPLGRLVAACTKAAALPLELLRRLGAIEATLDGARATDAASPDVPEAAVAAVAEAERLWRASSSLASRHLLGTLGHLRDLLVSGPGGPEVAPRCREAIEDIPGLLRRR
ncbi:antifreeze protein Maxi-like [Aphelocoma coerulescens]|uniref:antifreeze protein Maxi-like n=1 Tax=Aphelocoma coerulescens TaxID=39617 RepID=UPI00360451DB